MSDDDDDVDKAKGPRGRPFEPGQSGNPSGRPKGARNRSTLLAQAALDESTEEFLNKAKEMARNGDRTLLMLFLKHILPRQRLLQFEMPKLRTGKDVAVLMQSLLERVADGEITLDEAERVEPLARLCLRALEYDDFENRLRVLEKCNEEES